MRRWATRFALMAEDEIVAVMDGQRGVEMGDLRAEERRRAALAAFLGAGMRSPPSKALLVSALAGARRVVAEHRALGLALDQWLADEVRLRGAGRTPNFRGTTGPVQQGGDPRRAQPAQRVDVGHVGQRARLVDRAVRA
jgi:hypothetical protein